MIWCLEEDQSEFLEERRQWDLAEKHSQFIGFSITSSTWRDSKEEKEDEEGKEGDEYEDREVDEEEKEKEENKKKAKEVDHQWGQLQKN